MATITFSRAQTEQIVKLIQQHFQNSLDQEIGGFDAEFLLEFFSKEIGGHFYNQALSDVHSLLQSHFEDMADTVFNLEKPVADR
jgi:uncharacterized protein (DUF2164 family)